MARLRIETALGPVLIALDSLRAPETTAYFVDLVTRTALRGGSIFRVLSSELGGSGEGAAIDAVQFGMARGLAAPRTCIRHEHTALTGLHHAAWTVSAARFGPGELYGSFFVCLRDEPALDFGGSRQPDGEGFAAFGQLVQGREVIRRAHRRAEASGLLSAPIALLDATVLEHAAPTAAGG